MKIITIVATVGVLALGACSDLSKDSIERNAQYSSLDLNPDEQRIWLTLDQSQKDRAVAFIRNGGTLIASLGAD